MIRITLYLFLSFVVVFLFNQCDSVSSSSAENEISSVQPELIAPANQADAQSTNPQLRWQRFADSSSSTTSAGVNGDADVGYQLVISETPEFETLVVDTVLNRTSMRVRGLARDQDYFWRVRIRTDHHTSRWSATWRFRTRADVSEDDTEILELVYPEDGKELNAGSVPFEWAPVDNAGEYHYQLTTEEDFSELIADTKVSSTSANITIEEEGELYYWRVAPILPSGTGDWSDVWTFVVPGTSGGGDEAPVPTPPIQSGDYVQVQNGNFVVNGQTLRFAGTNAYYLPNYQKIDSRVVTRAFDAFEDAGITVIRMWAFYDGYDCGYSQYDASEAVIQTSPGEYSEQALRYLDQVIAEGKRRGMRFILPFINYWDELGGLCQYNTWAGASNPGRNMNFFLNNNDTQKWFRDYISMLLNRVNTETGIAYKNEPAIFAWQIMNEGRNSGQNPEILRDWYQEIARFIKQIDPNHLVGTGEEGFDEGTPSEYSVSQYSNTYVLRAQEGTSYIMNTALPEIDFGSAHWYGPDYGFGSNINDNFLNAQRAWLEDHVAIAADMGKPFILGEYGFPGWGDSRVLDSYNELWSHAEELELDGSLIWQFTADYVKCTEFGGNICWPDGRRDQQLYTDFRNHIQAMSRSR